MAVKILNGIDVDGSMNIVASDVPNLDASKITSGTFSTDRIPNLSGVYQPAGDYLTLETAETTFQPLGNYLTSVPAEYLTQTEGDARYLRLSGGTLTGNLTAPSFTGRLQGALNGAPDSTIWCVSGQYTDWGIFYDEGTPDKIHFKSGGVSQANIALDTGVVTTTQGNSSQWSTAYSWGNHASVGYLTSLPSHNHDTLYDAIGSADAVNLRIDEDVLPAIPTNNNQLTNGAGYVTSSGNTIIGTDSDINTSGYDVIDNLYMTDGVITSHGTRQLHNIRIEDTRAAEKTPNDYLDYGVSFEFTDRITSGWHSVMTLQGWHDGYTAWQIIGPSNSSTHENWYLRSGISTTWGGLKRIWHSGDFSSTNITNWNTAYGWGNHASAGYLTSIPSTYATDAEVNSAVSVVNDRIDTEILPSIPTNNNQLTNGAGYITGYTETDTLDSVVSRNGSTGNQVNLSGSSNRFNGHHYFDQYDSSGNHYPHYVSGSGGAVVNTRVYRNATQWRLFVLNGKNGSISWDGNELATQSYVTTQINNVIDSAPGVLNTLNELAAALGDDANFSTTVSNNIGAINTRIDEEVLPAIPTNNNQLTNGAGYITSADGGNAQTLDGIDSSSFLRSDANDTHSGQLALTSITAASGSIANTKGSYLHIGAWGTGRTAADAVLVNTAYRSDILSYTRSFTIGNTARNFNGSSNVSWTLAEIGAEAAGAADAVNTRIDEDVLPAIPTNNNQLTNGAGYLTSLPNNAATFTNNIYLSDSATTANFITQLTNLGAFQDNYKSFKVAWDYAGNSNLDVGFESVELAGCVIECWGGTYKHVRLTRPTTGTGGRSIYVYNDQGSSYAPGWRQIWTSDEFSSTNISNWNTAYGWGNHASAGYLTTLGFSYSTGVTANHVVQRDANGYIYANHINFSSTETENPTISSFFVSNGDGWSRKASVAHVKSQLGLGSAAYVETSAFDSAGSADSVNSRIDSEVLPAIPTNNNQLTNGAGYLTTSGKAADSEAVDGVDSSRIVFGGNANKTTNVSSVSTALPSGFYDGYQVTGTPTNTWYTYINMRHNNTSNNYGSQIAVSFYNNADMYVRTISNGTYQGWSKIWNEANFDPASKEDAGAAAAVNDRIDSDVLPAIPSATDILTLLSTNNIVDWTVDQGSTNIHSGNYTNTTYSVGDGGLTEKNFTSALKTKLDGIAAGATNVTNNNQLTNGAGYLTSIPSSYATDAEVATAASNAEGNAKAYADTKIETEVLPAIPTNNNQLTNGAGYVTSSHTHTPSQVGLSNLSADGNSLNGNFTATGDITAFSDARVKENVETLPNALESVKQMRGVTYNKIGEEKQSIGVIAQELEEVVPQLVHTDEEGMKSVAYGNITALLIEALKEQQEQIEELKAKLNGLTK